MLKANLMIILCYNSTLMKTTNNKGEVWGQNKCRL